MNDTSPDAERAMIEAYRRMSPNQKWQRLGSIFRFARNLVEAGVRAENPNATDEQVRAACRERYRLGRQIHAEAHVDEGSC